SSNGGHLIKQASQLLVCQGDVFVPLYEFRRGVESAQIEVSRSVTKPPPHLHERVIHPGSAEIIAHTQALEREAAGELVPSDCDDANALFSLVRVIENVFDSAIDLSDLDSRDRIEETFLHLVPGDPRAV